MLHGAGIFTYIYPKNDPNVRKYSSTMEHLGFGSVLEHVPPFIPFQNNLMYLLLMMFYEEDPANMAPNVQGFRCLFEPLRRGYEKALRQDQITTLHNCGLGGPLNQLTLADWYNGVILRVPCLTNLCLKDTR